MNIESSSVRCLGGATGIGLATAQLASSPGTQVTVVSNRGEDVDNPLDQLPAGTCGYTADLLDPQGRGRVVRQGRHYQPPRVHGWTERQLQDPDNTTQAANMMLGLRVIGPSTPCRLAIRHMSNKGSITLTSGTAGHSETTLCGWWARLDVPHTLVRDGAVFGLRGSCRVGRVQRYVEGIFPNLVPEWAPFDGP